LHQGSEVASWLGARPLLDRIKLSEPVFLAAALPLPFFSLFFLYLFLLNK
jgi:hypothetical protein